MKFVMPKKILDCQMFNNQKQLKNWTNIVQGWNKLMVKMKELRGRCKAWFKKISI